MTTPYPLGSGEMVERVAEAIRSVRNESDYMSNGDLGRVQIDGYFDLRKMARAAIEAMREPTQAMVQAGFEHTGDPCWEDDVALAWVAMIDAALTP